MEQELAAMDASGMLLVPMVQGGLLGSVGWTRV
jgi:hypothetical protein